MKTVPLSGPKAAGRVVFVDDDDYALVMQYRWHVRERTIPGRRTDGPYAYANVWRGGGKYQGIPMHRLITGWPRTDHIDHNGLNNQRSNLRPATSSQNGANQRKQSGRSSQYKGVCKEKRSAVWRSYIGGEGNGSRRTLGWYRSEEDAARAYDAAARELYGEYAFLNFPGETLAAPEPSRKGQNLQPCGTAAAYVRHQKHSETPCEACHVAFSAYKRANKLARQQRASAA